MSFLADYSVDKMPFENPLFRFDKKYLGCINNDVYITLEKWVSNNVKDQNDLIL